VLLLEVLLLDVLDEEEDALDEEEPVVPELLDPDPPDPPVPFVAGEPPQATAARARAARIGARMAGEDITRPLPGWGQRLRAAAAPTTLAA
jgi:hypothetical protein